MDLDQLSWIIETPGNRVKERVSLYTETGIRTRKFHHKSRKGCKGCKRRRIKCDERQPGCGQCADRRKVCEYLGDMEQTCADQMNENALSRGQSSRCTEYRPDAADVVESASQPTKPPYLHPGDRPVLYHWIHAGDALDHFCTYPKPWLGSPLCQSLMQQHAVPLSSNAPYLLHAILAAATAHLATLKPEHGESYQIASTVHYHHSLKLYSEAINGDLREADADAIYAASILHAIMAFTVSPKALTEGLAGPDDEYTDPTWVKTWRGVYMILHTPQLFERLQTGVWLPLIRVYEAWRDAGLVGALRQRMHHGGGGGGGGGECPIGPLKVFCTTGPGLLVDGAQMDWLHVLFHLEGVPDDIDGCIAYMCSVPLTGMGHWLSNDVRARLMLCYWWALLGRFDQWWIGDSARIECVRILMRLENNTDPSVRNLLRFPAECAGYALKGAY